MAGHCRGIPNVGGTGTGHRTSVVFGARSCGNDPDPQPHWQAARPAARGVVAARLTSLVLFGSLAIVLFLVGLAAPLTCSLLLVVIALLRLARAGVGLPERRWHDLRHTAATLMLAAGVPERVIMEILGHSRLDMTILYSLVLPPTRREAMTRVDALLEPAETPTRIQWLHGGLQNGHEHAADEAKTGVLTR